MGPWSTTEFCPLDKRIMILKSDIPGLKPSLILHVYVTSKFNKTLTLISLSCPLSPHYTVDVVWIKYLAQFLDRRRLCARVFCSSGVNGSSMVPRQTTTHRGGTDRTLWRWGDSLGVKKRKHGKYDKWAEGWKIGFYLNLERCLGVSFIVPLGRNLFLLLTQGSDTSFSVLAAHQLR